MITNYNTKCGSDSSYLKLKGNVASVRCEATTINKTNQQMISNFNTANHRKGRKGRLLSMNVRARKGNEEN